mmetsp:Transcript_41028/g.36373  ORF Transcript_41028/g.36373 Transcript_41028/m.36373 type:complete len:93 (-) Transcript_41028:386-664(-)
MIESLRNMAGDLKNTSDIALINSKANACCTVEKNGIKMFKQKAYHCKTCKILGNEMICEDCIRYCHKGHSIEYWGYVSGYCDCRFSSSLCEL